MKYNVTIEEYKDSLEILISLALKYQSAATEAAAEIILSINNSPKWKFNLGNLRSLDPYNYKAAMIAIAGYRKHGIYPYNLIQDSDARLKQLKKTYNYLAIKSLK